MGTSVRAAVSILMPMKDRNRFFAPVPARVLAWFLAAVLSLSASHLHAQSALLDHTEILGRLAVGYSPSYVAHLVKTRGVNFSMTAQFLDRVRASGGAGILIERLSSANPPASLIATNTEQGPVEHLGRCAELVHMGDTESAKQECRASIDESPKSPWPLLVSSNLAWVLSPGETYSAENAERARDEFLGRAAALAPKLPMAHPGSLPNNDDPDAVLEFNEAGSSSLGISFLNADDDNSPRAEPLRDGTVSRIPWLRSRMQVEPDLASNHLALVNAYVAAHDLDSAESEVREALRLEPDHAQLRTIAGNFYLSQGKTEAGLAELREAVRIAPFFGDYYIDLANALERLDRTPEAIKQLQTIVALHPADAGPTGFLVRLYRKDKNLKSAIEAQRSLLKAVSPNFPDEATFVAVNLSALLDLADLLKADRQPEAAAEEYLLLLRFNPDNAALHEDYGNVLADEGQLDEAIGEYNETLRLVPEVELAAFSGVHHNIALCLIRKKDLDGAINEFRQAIALDPDGPINPDEPNTRVYLGAALRQKGDLNGAIEQFQEAIETNPKDAQAHAGVGSALMELKDAFGAISELKVALELQPDSPAVENDLAWIYATAEDPKLRNPTEALALARRAVTSSPQNPAFIDTLAEALLLNGHPAEALAMEMEAAKLDPKNSDLQSRLAHFREAANSVTPATR
jgi:tetratricopeptide (TPR) repeat protein